MALGKAIGKEVGARLLVSLMQLVWLVERRAGAA